MIYLTIYNAHFFYIITVASEIADQLLKRVTQNKYKKYYKITVMERVYALERKLYNLIYRKKQVTKLKKLRN